MRYMWKIIVFVGLGWARIGLGAYDWESLETEHFLREVGGRSATEFADYYVEKYRALEPVLLGKSRTIETDSDTFIVYYPAHTDDNQVNVRELTTMSYLPHLWIRKEKTGEVMEVGSSFIMPRDQFRNPRLIEQELFYFSGPYQGKAQIENW